ncbi:MAG: GTP-binding protein [Acidimicrobiia bacterium]
MSPGPGHRRLAVTVVAGGEEAAGVAAGLARLLAPRGVALVGPPEAVGDGPHADGVLAVPARPATGYRTAGCECCSMRVDVLDALGLVVRRRRPPRHAVVVTPHDAVGVAQTVLSDPDLAAHLRLDAVVATCEGPALSTRIAAGGPLGTEEELATLAAADAVVVAGAHRLSPGGMGAVRRTLRSVSRAGQVLAPRGGTAVLSLVDRRAWRGRMASAPGAAVLPPPDGGPATVVVEAEGPLGADGVRAWLDRVVDDHAPGLLRLQGELCVAEHERAVDCVGMRSFVTTRRGRALPAAASHVSLVGWGLDGADLAAGLRSTASA